MEQIDNNSYIQLAKFEDYIYPQKLTLQTKIIKLYVKLIYSRWIKLTYAYSNLREKILNEYGRQFTPAGMRRQ